MDRFDPGVYRGDADRACSKDLRGVEGLWSLCSLTFAGVRLTGAEKGPKPDPKPLYRPPKGGHQEGRSRTQERGPRQELVMACGTGKTRTALHIAERAVGSGGLVLYLVPSLSLIPQAMREWADHRTMPHQYMAVCSDSTGRKRRAGIDNRDPHTAIHRCAEHQKRTG